jgi:hypothetical protein
MTEVHKFHTSEQYWSRENGEDVSRLRCGVCKIPLTVVGSHMEPKILHYSYACPMRALDDIEQYTDSFAGVTCQVCRAQYGRTFMERVRARRKLTVIEATIVKRRNLELDRQAASIKKRTAKPWRLRVLALLAPILACLVCPAHIALIAAFLCFGVHVGSHSHEEGPLYIGVGFLITVAILLLDRWHHKEHCHQHEHQDGRLD